MECHTSLQNGGKVPYWDSATYGDPRPLILQIEAGNMVIRDANGVLRFETLTTGEPISKLQLTQACTLQLLREDGSVAWSAPWFFLKTILCTNQLCLGYEYSSTGTLTWTFSVRNEIECLKTLIQMTQSSDKHANMQISMHVNGNGTCIVEITVLFHILFQLILWVRSTPNNVYIFH